MTAHTPLPWVVAKPEHAVFMDDRITICTADGERSICDLIGYGPIDAASATFIVQACNAHTNWSSFCTSSASM